MNLVEGNRLRGSVGGMFENPNDLALNLVTFLRRRCSSSSRPEASPAAVRRRDGGRHARGDRLHEVAQRVPRPDRDGRWSCSTTRSRVQPGVVFAVVLAGAMPCRRCRSSFWDRMDSIMNAEEDQTGSRAARLRLIDAGRRRSSSTTRSPASAPDSSRITSRPAGREVARDPQRLAAGGGGARDLRADRRSRSWSSAATSQLRGAPPAARPRARRLTGAHDDAEPDPRWR